ncbi:hypothetical protein, partial [Enterobacter hormaechei]|uniref:hypothetical protein n=1 Tax=Enterobacter hormaechei TaxID=158836 RepID=UPI001CA32FA0
FSPYEYGTCLTGVAVLTVPLIKFVPAFFISAALPDVGSGALMAVAPMTSQLSRSTVVPA